MFGRLQSVSLPAGLFVRIQPKQSEFLAVHVICAHTVGKRKPCRVCLTSASP